MIISHLLLLPPFTINNEVKVRKKVHMCITLWSIINGKLGPLDLPTTRTLWNGEPHEYCDYIFV